MTWQEISNLLDKEIDRRKRVEYIMLDEKPIPLCPSCSHEMYCWNDDYYRCSTCESLHKR